MLNIREMMVIGCRTYSFKGNRGEDVVMVQLFCTYDAKGVEGTAAASMSVSEKAFIRDGIAVGMPIRAAFANKKWEYVGA